ncbi:MAG TPA: sulfite oxidase [Gemmatimonadales bacterium]|jgi:sulfite oxidase
MPDTRRIVRDTEALNSGVVGPGMVEQPITPTDWFFTRSHATVPAIDRAAWRLSIDGMVASPTTLSFDDLIGRYRHHTVPSTLMCAGLRRDELLTVAPLPGELPWGPEPVSTGAWGGVRLADLLADLGVDAEATHVEFTGLDTIERDGRTISFGGSIEIAKARESSVLLATELNGAPLAPRHGFPVRALVPGWYGARSVKWLGRITLRANPSENYFQTRAYRVQRTVLNGDPRDVRQGTPLGAVPLNAMIIDPSAGDTVPAGPVQVRGWAIGTGGAPLHMIELSADGGASWQPVEQREPASEWAWTLWRCDLSLAPGAHTLIVRATDATGAVQPDTLAATWNVKGYANNAWHRITVTAA